MLDDFKVILYEYRAALKKKSQRYKATLNLEYMFKINLISGFRFIILWNIRGSKIISEFKIMKL
jgi:hypothetical protein